MPSLPCSALIFDLDGVLIDSNPLYERHWKRWAERNGVPCDEVLAVHHGRPVSSTIRQVAPHLDANAQALAYKAGLEKTRFFDDVRMFPGAHELLQELPTEVWAIATSAPGAFARRLMRKVGLPEPRVLITGDDVSIGKPHPMPFLQAAKALGVCADKCIVIEDAPAGITAAVAAGAYTLGVLTTNTAESLVGAHAITGSIADILVQCEPFGLQVSWTEALVPAVG